MGDQMAPQVSAGSVADAQFFDEGRDRAARVVGDSGWLPDDGVAAVGRRRPWFPERPQILARIDIEGCVSRCKGHSPTNSAEVPVRRAFQWLRRK